MSKIFIPIDIKSLHYKLPNDNLKGHTATVATTIKQGKQSKEELQKIFTIPKQIEFTNDEKITCELIKSSKSMVTILNVFVFDKIKVNGQPVDTNGKSFCMYVKKEIDSLKANYGREKLHYPFTTKFSNNDFEIDNKYIIERIYQKVFNYAFVCSGFEFDFIEDTLNFCIDIIGLNTPYSKVFINSRGTGIKTNNVNTDENYDYNYEIYKLKEFYGNDFGPEDFNEQMFQDHQVVDRLAIDYLEKIGATRIQKTKEKFPIALFNITYEIDGVVNYLMTKFSYTNTLSMMMTSNEMGFISQFGDVTKMFYVSSFKENNKIHIFNREELYDSAERKIEKMLLRGGVI